jgi:hypothetical protein
LVTVQSREESSEKKDGWGMAIPHPSFFSGDSPNTSERLRFLLKILELDFKLGRKPKKTIIEAYEPSYISSTASQIKRGVGIPDASFYLGNVFS